MPLDPAVLQYIQGQVQLTGMTMQETIIAQAWIAKHHAEFDSVDFQVRLGSELDIGPGYSDAIRRQAAINSQKRADMIAMSGDQATIVEVKIRVSLGAMGQLLGYRTLWHAEHPAWPDANLVAIGNDALVDVNDLLAAHGITVEVFPSVLVAVLPEVPE